MMPRDVLEELAKFDVPPPPAQFDRRVHDRLNQSLLLGQLVELAVRAIPQAMLEFARGVACGAFYTITGRDPLRKETPHPDDPPP